MADDSNGQEPNRPWPKWPGSHLKQVTSPGLKCPTWSQVVNGNLKVCDLKVCIFTPVFVVIQSSFVQSKVSRLILAKFGKLRITEV